MIGYRRPAAIPLTLYAHGPVDPDDDHHAARPGRVWSTRDRGQEGALARVLGRQGRGGRVCEPRMGGVWLAHFCNSHRLDSPPRTDAFVAPYWSSHSLCPGKRSGCSLEALRRSAGIRSRLASVRSRLRRVRLLSNIAIQASGMPPTTHKRQEAAVQARTVPVTRAKRKAAQRKNPSTSTATTRRRGRPPAATTTAPRKTAYKDKRGQTPALPTVEASSDAETEEATEEETSPRPTPQLDETSNDDSEGQTEAAATSHNRKADPKPSAETEKIIVSQVNDSSSSDDDSEEATVVRNLLTPRKRQERRQASSDEGGDATARAGTVIPETDYEGPVFTSPQRSPRRAGQKTHGKQKRPDKGKGKAVDPSPSPPLAQGGPAEEEEAGESDRSADSDRREDEEVVAAVDQRQPVASTSRKPSQKKSSGAAPPRSPPKERVAASASQKSPARRPASSSSHARKSPAKRQAQQQQDPTPETGSASSEDEGQPSRQRTSPRRRFELAPSEDEVTDDGEDETKTMYPPEIFQHRDFIEAEDGRRRRVWVADRFWVHDLWGPGGREEVVACLEVSLWRGVPTIVRESG